MLTVWLIPAIQSIHLCALALLGGSVLILDLRLLGLGLIEQSPKSIEANTRPWLILSVGTLILSGGMMFWVSFDDLIESQTFWIKMAALIAALTFTFGLRNPRARRNQSAKWIALVSLSLWLTVAICGRWIGFS